MPSKEELKYLQSLPLDIKIAKTKQRIREWVNRYGVDGVYVSFSGGKDSTVLLHIVREMYPDVEAVFVNTGLEYPEIQRFVKSFDNVTILRPKMRFDEVIRKYGYPFISKEVSQCIKEGKSSLRRGSNSVKLSKLLYGLQTENGGKSIFDHTKYKPLLYVDFNISDVCCKVMKKSPVRNYAKVSSKVAITAQTAEESFLRRQNWLRHGCNAFESKYPVSNPMSFWVEQDILQYIKQNKVPIASVYGDIVYGDKYGAQYENLICDCNGKLCTTGCERTGCIFCGFGAHLDKGESRFERLKRTHPKQYAYCMGGGAYDTDGLWKPTKDGLGMAHCIDELNKIYGKDFIKY
ncbi:MAG: phosphoadenosine phosphosulfate reductase family protein [Clostridiales bacterium]|nr:phosphoadenosine phosphosulfate reductase family protein [Clostridiales bacterium]